MRGMRRLYQMGRWIGARGWAVGTLCLLPILAANLGWRPVLAGPTELAMVMPGRDLTSDGAGSGNSGSGWTDSYCGRRCHQNDAVFSHPVDRTPSMPVPAHLPLADGRITCLTCHQNSSEAHVHARLNHDGMLRDSAPSGAFCTQCHAATSSTRGAFHAMALGRAHPGWPDAKARTAGAEANADSSQKCLSCHDGVMSAAIGSGTEPTNAGSGHEHPVDITYPGQSADRRGEMGLISADRLTARVRLSDNRVGCNSCHSLFSREPKLLVMSNTGSRLCLTCHQQR